jgi:hypothetical protein
MSAMLQGEEDYVEDVEYYPGDGLRDEREK